MRKNVAEIMHAWYAASSKRTASIWTDSRTVYSYDLAIASRDQSGQILVVSHDVKMPTQTTAIHMSQVRSWIMQNCPDAKQAPLRAVYLLATNPDWTADEAHCRSDK